MSVVKSEFLNSSLKRVGIVALMLLASVNVASTPATLVSQAQLKSKPSFQAQDMTTLNKGDAVEILQRNRGWYQVKVDTSTTGWITLLQVKLDRVEKSTSKKTKAKYVSLRRGHSEITATTGVRGIGEEDIKQAKPDFQSLEIAKQYLISQREAAEFASQVPLHTQSITYQEKKNEK